MERKRSTGFRRIFTVTFIRFGSGNVNDCPEELEAPAVARYRRKATMKIFRDLSMIQIFGLYI